MTHIIWKYLFVKIILQDSEFVLNLSVCSQVSTI